MTAAGVATADPVYGGQRAQKKKGDSCVLADLAVIHAASGAHSFILSFMPRAECTHSFMPRAERTLRTLNPKLIGLTPDATAQPRNHQPCKEKNVDEGSTTSG
eukprot:5909758-Amphidinium_carterae.1